MQARPNKTILEGEVMGVHPHADGVGVDVELVVSRNASTAVAEDFIRSARGDIVRLFAAERPHLEKGQRVRVQARLLAGPFGQRTILEHFEPIAEGG